MNERYLQQALSAISVRRNNAQTIQQQHLAEIAQTVPEIMEINQQLFHTSQDLIQIIRSGENVAERTQRLAQQNQQGQAMIRKLLVQHGYPQNYLDIVYQCPDCNDTGYANGTFCHCLLKLAGKLATKELNKSAQVQLCRFDTFSLDYYRGQTTEHGSDCYTAMQKILAYCQNYAQYFHKSSPSILMFGKTGLGKTHLSLSIASVALERGYSVLYDSVINFLRKIEREHFGKEHPETDTMELLLTCDLLILDDLGTEFDSSFSQSTIYNLINTRLNRSLPTIISTNLDFNGISNRYEERITSRIYANYSILRFVGQDVRIMKAQQAFRKEKERGNRP